MSSRISLPNDPIDRGIPTYHSAITPITVIPIRIADRLTLTISAYSVDRRRLVVHIDDLAVSLVAGPHSAPSCSWRIPPGHCATESGVSSEIKVFVKAGLVRVRLLEYSRALMKDAVRLNNSRTLQCRCQRHLFRGLMAMRINVGE